MKFDPKDAETPFFAEGEAFFEVLSAEEKKSKSGNDMIELKLKISDSTGKIGTMNEYLPNTKKALFKIRDFARATGQYDKFKSGTFDATDCIFKNGKCLIKHEDEKAKIKSYIDITDDEKNKTAQKVVKNANSVSVVKAPEMPDVSFSDEDVPF